ncbi:5962_t:CDS:2 [Rhizophagus irregularis]|nr:5962_t:CDS:2 [Rhizophagus irregularis]
MSNLIKSSLTSGPTKKSSYKVPLPLSLSPSILSRFLSYFTPFTLFTTSTRKIKGKYDEKTQAVIICNREDMEKLWKEGFFGKAEQITEQRRIVRKRNKKGRVNQVQNMSKVQQITKEEVQEKEQDEEQTIEQTLTQEEENVLLEDIETLMLTTQEAFFLCYGLGILDIYDLQDNLLSAEESWKSFQITSSGFIIRYIVYHYFRSLGWVVRCGMKFGVDYVLYEKGPVFKHAEYAVIILPIHTSQNFDNSQVDVDFRNNCMTSWSWMMNLNRVCVQVKKSV